MVIWVQTLRLAWLRPLVYVLAVAHVILAAYLVIEALTLLVRWMQFPGWL